MSESDSMWLQKSIALADPIPEEEESDASPEVPAKATPPSTAESSQSSKHADAMPPPSQSIEKKTSGSVTPVAEMDLTKMVMDSSSFLRTNSAQRPSVRYNSRASVSSSAFISAHEYDDLRARYSQAKRELLKLSDIQKDFDFARFELTRSQEEVALLRESNQTLKHELEECVQRMDREHKARMSLENRVSAEGASRGEEVDFLKKTIEELREENARRLDELTQQQESEFQNRFQSMREELANAVDEVDRLAAEVTQTQKSKEAADGKLSAALAELEKARAEVADGKTKIEALQQTCQQLEQQHRDFVAQREESRTREMKEQSAYAEQRVLQLTTSKDATIHELQDDLRQWKAKAKATGEELTSAKLAVGELQDELKQLTADHAKELRRLAEEHRLALCEKQLQMEAAVREARGSKTSIEEEAHSLRRQLTQVSGELSTVAGVLAQREKQLAQTEEELAAVKDRCLHAEQENAQLATDAEMNAEAAAAAEMRVERLNQQKDDLEEEFSKDVRELKDRVRSLEAQLNQSSAELASLRRQQIKSDDSGVATARDLRAQIETLTEQRVALTAEAAERRRFEESAADYRRRFESEKAKAAALAVELNAALSRCTTLEEKCETQARQVVSQTLGRSPMQTLSANAASLARSAKYRSVSSQHSQRSTPDGAVKRARTEDARVFALSGFETNELLDAVRQMPNVAIAECRSNAPVPSNLTHLITSGNLTVKLLTALVRGCWVLPRSYVTDSLERQCWQREEAYGFQHEVVPLLKKRVAMTKAFMSCKHYETGMVLLREGGAILVDDPEEADVVLCTNSEVRRIEKGWSWEKMVDVVYPVKISDE